MKHVFVTAVQIQKDSYTVTLNFKTVTFKYD